MPVLLHVLHLVHLERPSPLDIFVVFVGSHVVFRTSLKDTRVERPFLVAIQFALCLRLLY